MGCDIQGCADLSDPGSRPRRSLVVNHTDGFDIATNIGAKMLLHLVGIGPAAPISLNYTDLQAAMDKGVTVARGDLLHSISVAEHIVMMILALVRNYIPSYGWVVRGGWNIADCVERSYGHVLRAGVTLDGEISRHECRHCRRRPHRSRGASPAEAIRRAASLL